MRITKKIKDKMLAILEDTYKDTKSALNFNNPFELLIAVILSAQCTDKRVNVTTARLFAKAATPEAILNMGVEELENEIRDCGLFRNKAKNIIATCHKLCSDYHGQVPSDFDELLKLPGVGRRTDCSWQRARHRTKLNRDCKRPSRWKNGRTLTIGSSGTDAKSAAPETRSVRIAR